MGDAGGFATTTAAASAGLSGVALVGNGAAGPWVTAGVTLCSASWASKTSWQRPQRTQPSEMRNWSATTRNLVPQAGQQVIRLMESAL